MGDVSRAPSRPRADERTDVRAELDRFETGITDLKQRYEQYFTGVLPLPPDKLHGEVKSLLRRLRKAPFRNSAMNFRLRVLETRYNTYVTYFERVIREKESGTYSKDVFKAGLREKNQQEEAYLATAKGGAERGMVALFNTYRAATERATGRAVDLDFKTFQESLVKRAKEFKERHGVKKLSFKIVVNGTKVSVQARAREPQG